MMEYLIKYIARKIIRPICKKNEIPTVELMPLLLAPASVSVLADLETVRTMLAPLLLAGFVGTSVVMLITGQVVQRIVRRGGGRSEK